MCLGFVLRARRFRSCTRTVALGWGMEPDRGGDNLERSRQKAEPARSEFQAPFLLSGVIASLGPSLDVRTIVGNVFELMIDVTLGLVVEVG